MRPTSLNELDVFMAGEQRAGKRGKKSGEMSPYQIRLYKLWREFGVSKCDRKQL